MIADVSPLVNRASLDHSEVAEHVVERLADPLPLSMTHRIRSLTLSPRSIRPFSSVVHSAAFSVEPCSIPSGILSPVVVIPSATTSVCFATSDAVDHERGQVDAVEAPAMSSHSLRRVRSTKCRLVALFDVPRLGTLAGVGSTLRP
jgi:hypothetical protein